jgi:hypothetical protein
MHHGRAERESQTLWQRRREETRRQWRSLAVELGAVRAVQAGGHRRVGRWISVNSDDDTHYRG